MRRTRLCSPRMRGVRECRRDDAARGAPPILRRRRTRDYRGGRDRMVMGGSFVITAPIQRVWEALFDIPTMTSWVPGVAEARRVDETHYEVTIEQRVAFL